MLKTNGKKITLTEALIIYIMVLYTPFIRYVASTVIMGAHQAGWFVPLVSNIVFIPLVFILYKVMHTFKGQPLNDVLCHVFSKPIGKVVSILYIAWLFILLSLYIRYASEKVIVTAFVGTDIKLIMFLLCITVTVMLRWGLQVFARMNKMIFALSLAQFIIAITLLLLNLDVKKITPISTLDILPILETTIFMLSVMVYITPLFIFNDQIQYGKKDIKKFMLTTTFLTVAGTLLVVTVLGLFGYKVAGKLIFPFLTAVENISISGRILGFDSFFLAVWLIGEFTITAFFAYCIVRSVKNVFKLKNDVPVLTPVMAFALFFAVFYATDLMEIIVFSKGVAPVLNLIFGLGIPVILFITAKIRKLV